MYIVGRFVNCFFKYDLQWMTARVQMKNILLYKHDNDLIIATKMRFGWGDGVRHETSFSNDPPTKHEEHGCLCPV